MKKILLLVGIVALAFSDEVCAQGTVNFTSSSANHIILIDCVPCQEGQTRVALYAGAFGATQNELVQIGASVLNGAGGGVSGGSRTSPFVTGGGIGTFQIRAWTGDAATWEQAIATGTGLLGMSAVFNNATGNPVGEPPTPPTSLTGWTSPVEVGPLTPTACPEPSTVGLGVLGAASLVFFRRRRKTAASSPKQ